jgi:hypothetical protein
VPVASEDCAANIDTKLLASNDTVWLGAMLPLTGPRAEGWGKQDADVLELARRDFAEVGGIPGSSNGTMRPLGIVVCDSARDPTRAANHLADLDVPAVLGFGAPLKDVIDLTTNVLMPRHILVVDMFNESPLLTRIPQAAGAPRLVWRLTASAEQAGIALARVVTDYAEPSVHGTKGGARETRLAIVRSESSTPASIMDAAVSSLRLNGKPLVENGAGFRQLVFRRDPPSPTDNAALIAELVAFAPHVIAYADGVAFEDAFVEGIEREWKAPYRPLYLSATRAESERTLAWIGTNTDRRRRFLSIDLPANTDANFKFVLHYNEHFTPKIEPSNAPGVVYDAFYVVAFAAAATMKSHISGTDLATAMSRLGGDGAPVAVGPARIFEAYDVLRGGGTLRLAGAGTSLDFDHAAGEIPNDFVVYCIGVDRAGRAAAPVESGLRYDHASRHLAGALRCP